MEAHREHAREKADECAAVVLDQQLAGLAGLLDLLLLLRDQ
jgi:hypothetical protein